MPLILSALSFAIFAANVLMGALLSSPFMGDVAEALTLLAAAILFVVAILRREAARDRISKGGPQ